MSDGRSAPRPGRTITKVLGFGPRKRNVLAGLVGGHKNLRGILEALIARGRVVVIGRRRGALYALRGWRRGGGH